jgi:outer membrane lipoprotein-sorting protein
MLTDKAIEEKLHTIRFTTSKELDRRMQTTVFESFLDEETSVNTPTGSNGRIVRAIANTPGSAAGMKASRRTVPSRSRRFAVTTRIAASVLFFVGVAWMAMMIGVPGKSIVLAQVVEKATQAKSVTFVQKVQSEGKTVLELKGYLQGDQLRWEMPRGIICVERRKDRKGLFLDTAMKEAAPYDLPKDTESLSRWQTDPIDWLQRIKPGNAKSLGRELLDGKKVAVFLTKYTGLFTSGGESYGFAPEQTVKMWVDQQTDLPLKIAIGDPQEAEGMTFTEMKWNERLASNLFLVDVPDGYTELKRESFRSRFPQSTRGN